MFSVSDHQRHLDGYWIKVSIKGKRIQYFKDKNEFFEFIRANPEGERVIEYTGVTKRQLTFALPGQYDWQGRPKKLKVNKGVLISRRYVHSAMRAEGAPKHYLIIPCGSMQLTMQVATNNELRKLVEFKEPPPEDT
jgi:hypothetical protein